MCGIEVAAVLGMVGSNSVNMRACARAAAGAGAAITYTCGGTLEKIALTITNTPGNVGGMVCDGAKASCAAKIASSVDAVLLAF